MFHPHVVDFDVKSNSFWLNVVTWWSCNFLWSGVKSVRILNFLRFDSIQSLWTSNQNQTWMFLKPRIFEIRQGKWWKFSHFLLPWKSMVPISPRKKNDRSFRCSALGAHLDLRSAKWCGLSPLRECAPRWSADFVECHGILILENYKLNMRF